MLKGFSDLEVLIVEDNQGNIDLLRYMLSELNLHEQNVRAEVAKDTMDAWHQIKMFASSNGEKHRLILLDHHLEGGGKGLEIAQKCLKDSDSRINKLNIIFTSSDDSIRNDVEELDYKFMYKPYKIKDLEDNIYGIFPHLKGLIYRQG